MLKLAVALSFAILLPACGGGGGGGNSNDTEDDNSIGLADLVGTWQIIDSEEPDDITYTVIKEDGSFTDYDYFGDPVGDDNGNVVNCYGQEIGQMTELGNDQFRLSVADVDEIDFEFALTVEDYGFSAIILNVDEILEDLGVEEDTDLELTLELRRSELLVSDFEECD